MPHPNKISKLSVLMPIYNERWTLREIVKRVLNAPVEQEIELIAVDDGSTDGSWETLEELARADTRIVAVQHPKNCGKGAAIRTAIEHVTGEIAVVQDADLEYDPVDFPKLLQPILDGNADAVFGSRFAGHPRRVLRFWHSLMNRSLTLFSNMLNDLHLTDMETCYKMVRADVLKQLCLRSNTFTLEPELTCRLAQFGARIYEVPVSYAGRNVQEGKKIRASDGVKAIFQMLHTKFVDTQFTDHPGFYILTSVARAKRYHRWILQKAKRFLGQRLLEAGSGIGSLSADLLDREHVLLVEIETMYVSQLQRRFGLRENVRVESADLTNSANYDRWQADNVDTVFCSNVLEHVEPDEQVLQDFHRTLAAGGHCVIVVPAGRWLYTGTDATLGRRRRYTRQELADKMTAAGFEIVHQEQFSRLGAVAWGMSGHILRRRHLSARQVGCFDRLLPLAKVLEYCLPVPGMSLMMVGRKPDRAAARIAA